MPALANRVPPATGTDLPPNTSLIWRPLRRDGRVVDAVLSATGVAGVGGFPPSNYWAPGIRLTEAMPGVGKDGLLALLVRTVETGESFLITRPGRNGAAASELSGHLLSDETVLLQVRDLDGTPNARLALVKNRWERIIEDAPLGITITNFRGVLLEVNQALCRLLDRQPAEIIGHAFNEFTHPDDPNRLDRDAVLRTGRASMDKRYLKSGGETVHLRISASLVVENGERLILSICEDITAEAEARLALERQATIDEATGMWNRTATRNLLRRHLDELSEGAWPVLSLIILNIDRFKLVNSALGLEAGDVLIAKVAARLGGSLPEGAIIGRTGGDEFVVIAPGVDDPRHVAVGLQRSLDAPVAVLDSEVSVDASVGVVVARPGDLTSQRPEVALLRDADAALQVAKRSGTGCIVEFDDSLRQRALARLDNEREFRRALERDELVLHFQPIVRAVPLPGRADREFECLVRWQHPGRGLVPPGEFLSVAEEAGLMVPLGRRVLDLACRQAAVWRRGNPATRVAVNIAAEHIAAGTLVNDVFAALRRHRLVACALTLEVTERTLLHSHTAAAAALAELQQAGARIAIDDFGTGYSSLVYLRDLPVDILKIDRSFVAGLGTPDNDGTLFRAVVALSQSLSLETVAEGIETDAELAAVVASGVTYLQGYLLGRPSPP